ncbi:nitrate- and nitrite sensing domain-containing protein [Streptomyces minutiscleroticus]|uniref:nitrate- and nitrite sensing domain-containing protein n=1 Tax=Streptomyces minutiscleroticus TaxID=68238 RepID=UPI00167C78D7|nr:nitrate- and nitrite sensing domain-containing protein [Streptomyces minutiscleroticus]
MRAPVQMKRPRRKGRQTATTSTGAMGRTPDPAAPDPAGTGRPKHVRNRLIVAVAVAAAAVAGAGAPAVLAASEDLHDSQNLVTLAERTQQALTLAHSLADERDEVTSYLAAGRPDGEGPSEQRSARVDRQVEELRTDAPAALRADLDDVAAVRRAALTGKSGALETHEAYSAAITELHRLAEDLAERMPPRAGSGAHALADLDTAVQQAAAARGLLLAALSVPRSTQTAVDPFTGLPVAGGTGSAAETERRDALSAAAQQARVRSDAAVADFRDNAPKTALASYDSTVTGPEVTTAEKYLATLTDEPDLSGDDLGVNAEKVEAALSARVEQMRGVEASLNDRRTKDLARLRDDDVTALEIRVAVLGALALVAVGVITAMARSLTRPLSVLRRGSARLAADPAAEEPVKFTGRNDEFAQVVRSVNALHAHALALHERLATLEGDRKHLVGQRQTMADERERLRADLAEATDRLERLRTSIHGTFVSLALRTLGLVERQLGVIEGLEEREQDPDRLSTLFKLDHLATVMRRHSENLLVLAGAEHGQQHAGPVPLVDVVRAAVSEIERYDRVRIASLPPHAHVAGFAADDVSHLVAELLENASSFSPPDIPVEVSGWLLESGEVMLSVQDEGIGMTAERLEKLNARLAEAGPDEPFDEEGGEGLGLGLYVVARLAQRHGVRVQLREQKQGGIAAVAVLPESVLAEAPAVPVPTAATPVPGAAPAVGLPGADAEANSNELRGRDGRDPLITAAEEAVREASAEDAATAAPTPDAPDGTPAAGDDGTAAPAAGQPATGNAATEDAATEDAASFTEEPADAAHGDASAEDAARTGAAADEPGAHAGGPSSDEDEDGEDAAPGPETTMELLAPAPPAEDGAAPAPAGSVPAPRSEEAPRPGEAPAAAEPARPGEAPEVSIPAQATGDPYAIGPDAHERVADEGEVLTDKGLPKRTPRISGPAPARRPRAGGVDAEALRRRLGGFHQGANQGRRDVEAEIADQTAEHAAPAAPGRAQPPTAESVSAQGDPVEEERS